MAEPAITLLGTIKGAKNFVRVNPSRPLRRRDLLMQLSAMVIFIGFFAYVGIFAVLGAASLLLGIFDLVITSVFIGLGVQGVRSTMRRQLPTGFEVFFEDI